MTTIGYPAPGESVGPYRVGRRLGSGGMGVVFEALDPSLNRQVALKVISPDLAEDPDFRARFTREAQAQASLDSAHIVSVYAHGDDGGRLWIASQLIPDGDLRGMLDRLGAPPLAVALDVMAQVADGLADAHAAGLVHRDIKPANVLLRRRDTSYQAYLADFGIARLVDSDHTRTSRATIGTPSYMAPELHTGGRPGVASDVYSLGCLLWATLSGRAPYAGTSDFEIVTAHREQPVPQLPDDAPLAGPLNDVLRRTMAKDPAGRPGSAVAVRDRLRALHTDAERLTGPTGPPPVARVDAPAPPVARNRWPLAVGAVVVIAVVVALVIGYAVTRGDDSGPTARSRGTTPSTSGSTASTPSGSISPDSTGTSPTVPSSSGSPYHFKPGDHDTAVANMAKAFQTQLGGTYADARCYASHTIDSVGLQHLVDIGMFDADMNFHDIDLAAHPDVKNAITEAAVICAST